MFSELAVTVESQFLASAGCANLSKLVSNCRLLPVLEVLVMDPDPERKVGHTGLSGESDFHPAAPVSVATPAVTHPGAGPSSMVTRSRARGGRETNVEPEVEFRPEIEFFPEA